MKRYALLLAIFLVACPSGNTNNPPPPPPPPPGSLISLSSAPKSIVTGKITSMPDELWVAKGQTVMMTVTGNQLSPLVKRVQFIVSGSDGVNVTPATVKVDINTPTTFSVTVPNSYTGSKPFFFIYGYPYNQDNQKMDDQIRLDYKWAIACFKADGVTPEPSLDPQKGCE